MRTSSSVIVFSALVFSCGVFGSSASDDVPSAPRATPDQNAQPPIEGAPLTGIFASSSKGGALADADGSAAKPYKLLKDAIAVAKSTGQRVIACAEDYAEAVEVEEAVSMYGYYDCAQTPWARVNRPAIVRSPSSPALTARAIGHATRVEGFDIRAPDRDAEPPPSDPANRSSIGAYLVGSSALVFGASFIRGGNAARGPDGADAAANAETNGIASGGTRSTPQVVGAPCDKVAPARCLYQPGGAGGASKCAAGPSGGSGGNGGSSYYFYDAQDCATPSVLVTSHGFPSAATAATAAGGALRTKGDDGANGPDGKDGTNGAWTFANDAFVPGDGTPGTNGAPGQGGGGGGANDGYDSGIGSGCSPSSAFPLETANGGGGGAGGCPGLAGSPGSGGGASIGVYAIGSAASFEATQIVAKTGGPGGKGSLGTPGLVGGLGGVPSGSGALGGSGNGGGGGRGGYGGAAGISAHGAPGPSFALVWTGKRPVLDTNTQLVAGTPAAGQPALTKATQFGTKSVPATQGTAETEHSY